MSISRTIAYKRINEVLPDARKTVFGRDYLKHFKEGEVKFEGTPEELSSIIDFVRAGMKQSKMLVSQELLLEV